MNEGKQCPLCGAVLKVLFFLGLTPDGYVCEQCHIYYTEDLQPLALVVG